jgi:hypothetical protein
MIYQSLPDGSFSTDAQTQMVAPRGAKTALPSFQSDAVARIAAWLSHDVPDSTAGIDLRLCPAEFE